MKIAFGMIVFEGDYVLQECLEQVYPFAEQILISEGPVQYWQDKGKTTSTDKTNHILDNFPDPDNKIKIIHGQFSEKDDQCNAYAQYLNPDIDYLWNLDSDEVYKAEDLVKIINFLKEVQPSSVSVRSCSFYGGFDHYLTGMELYKDNFRRIFRVTPGSVWLTHRPPTIKYPEAANVEMKHVDGDVLFNYTGSQMYHYSYVFPDQVYKKIAYYAESLNPGGVIDNYFHSVYLPWVTGNKEQKEVVENTHQGVHEYRPEKRGECRTALFEGEHPAAITANKTKLQKEFDIQLKKYL